MHVYHNAHCKPERALDTLVLELQAIVSPVWVLRPNLQSFGRAASTLTAELSLWPCNFFILYFSDQIATVL